MTLANKYLRYSPKITLEIFTLVWNKLESLFPGKIYDWTKDWSFESFKEHGYISIWGNNNKYAFGINNNPSFKNKIETTVQEILGYNPFVKEEVIPEYVELLEGFDNTCTGKIFDTNQPIPQMNGWGKQWTWESIFKNDIQRSYFKSSTKEAFEAQNNPKPIEKWSVGSYVVAINDGHARGKPVDKYKIGFIDVITHNFYDETVGLKFSSNCCNNSDFKWFATKPEAEEFAKTLVESVKHGDGILDAVEVKQSLKQAVYCKTQEEWDFVTEKLGYKWLESRFENYKKNSCIGIQIRTSGYIWEFINNYQILSFQEWCDLNGYKMEKEVKFEVGKWYKNLGKNSSENTFGKFLDLRNKDKEFWMSEYIYRGRFADKQGWLDYSSETIEIDIEEIQQYLPDDHPNKITPIIQQVKDIQKANQEFKVRDWIVNLDASMNYKINEICKISLIEDGKIACEGKPISRSNQKDFKYFRHATPEEINNHLISIGQIPVEPVCTNTNSHKHDGCGEKYGCIQNCDECDYYQIPAGEPLNTGIEPNKDGVFKYTTVGGNSFSGECSTSITRVVEIIKPATIEFNYLPEPK